MSNGPKNGKWPSLFNQTPGAAIAPGRRIFISDCTLRDGEQRAGMVLDRAAKVAIARALDSLGIYEIEAGTVASSEEDRLAIAEKSGLVSIAYKVKELALPEQSFPEMLDRVKQAAVSKYRALTDQEFKMLANDLIC
jgi:HMGL-like